jgi:hypothetical protein
VKKKRQSRREAASEQVHNPGPTVTTRGSKRARSTS